jgi:hypothetical protein
MPVPYSPVGVGPQGKKGLTTFLGLSLMNGFTGLCGLTPY